MNDLQTTMDALELAWGLIANANDGDWDKAQNPDWKPAAERWRDEYHRLLSAYTKESSDVPS